MIELGEHPGGIILPVRAQPGARQNAIRGVRDGALRIAVTQVAEKGKANQAVLKLLCRSLALRRSQVILVAGHTSSDKRFLVRQIDRDTLRVRLAKLTADAGSSPDETGGGC